jgi:hypothetical protein
MVSASDQRDLVCRWILVASYLNEAVIILNKRYDGLAWKLAATGIASGVTLVPAMPLATLKSLMARRVHVHPHMRSHSRQACISRRYGTGHGMAERPAAVRARGPNGSVPPACSRVSPRPGPWRLLPPRQSGGGLRRHGGRERDRAGTASTASVAVSRYVCGSTPTSFADSHSV